MLKKLSVILLGSVMCIGSVSYVIGQQLPGSFKDQDYRHNPDVPGAAEDQTDTFLEVVQNIVNWILGLLGMIALVVLLRGGFQMVTAAGNEEKYKNGFKILKQAAFGLIFIGLSWLVVSIIFWVINEGTPE